MQFDNKPPDWINTGVEPPVEQKNNGFKPGQKAPASWFNWLFNKCYKAIKEIQEKLSNVDNTSDMNKPVSIPQKTALDGKVDKAAGKALSDTNFTQLEKDKLGLIEAQANKYVHPLTHPATVIVEDATHRFATDAEKSTWNAKQNVGVSYTKAESDSKIAGLTKSNVGLSNVDNTPDMSKPVSTAQQVALDGKVDKSTAVTTVAGRTGAVVLAKSDVGLPNVDNTSDINKPISTAQQTALNGKLSLTGGTMTGDILLKGDPTQALHPAPKQYVDQMAQGLDAKASVRLATTTNITLAGSQVIDGLTAVAGNRVLVKNQTIASENGIYVVAAGDWVRTTDADTSAKVTSGMYTFVERGTTQGDSAWVLATDTVTLGTTALSFVQFSGAGQITAGTGLTKTGNTLALGNIGAAGTYKKVVVDAQGRVISGGDLVAADIPIIPADKITPQSTKRFVTDDQINNWSAAEENAKTWAKNFGLGGYAKDISGSDANSLTTATGFFKGSGIINAPNSSWFFIINLVHSATFVVQMAYAFSTNGTGIYRRDFKSGVWSTWLLQETTQGAQDKADAAELAAKKTSVSLPIKLAAGSNLDSIISPGFYKSTSNIDACLNVPVASIAFSLLVEEHAGIKQTFTAYPTSSPRTFVRNKYSTTWGEWKELAITDVDPYTVAPMAGWTGTIKMFRTNKLVVVNFNISGGSTALNTVIANLPYKPTEEIPGNLATWSNVSDNTPCIIGIQTSGNVYLAGVTRARLSGQVVYFTA